MSDAVLGRPWGLPFSRAFAIPGFTDILQNMIKSEECTNAFIAAGATPLATQIVNGLTIISQTIAVNGVDQKQWTSDKAMSDAIREGFNWNSNALEVAYVGPHTDGSRYMMLADAVFKDDPAEHLGVVVAHALVHTGGQPGKAHYFTGTYLYPNKTHNKQNAEANMAISKHDLEWLGAKYNTVISACAGIEPKVGPARGVPYNE